MKDIRAKLVDVELIGGPEDGLCLPIVTGQFLLMQKSSGGRFAMAISNHIWRAKSIWNGLASRVRLYHEGVIPK